MPLLFIVSYPNEKNKFVSIVPNQFIKNGRKIY